MAKRTVEFSLREMLKPVYYGSRNEGGRWPRGHWTLKDADAACLAWVGEHRQAFDASVPELVRGIVRDIDRQEQADIADLAKMCLPGFEKVLERLLEKPIATAVGERVALGDCDPYEEWDNYWAKREDGFSKEEQKRERGRRVNNHVRATRNRGVRFATMRDLLVEHPVPPEVAA